MRRGAHLADVLALAASPTFGLMALLTVHPAGAAMVCGLGPGPSWLGGMTPMYLLMSAFHTGAWLRRA